MPLLPHPFRDKQLNLTRNCFRCGSLVASLAMAVATVLIPTSSFSQSAQLHLSSLIRRFRLRSAKL